MRPLHCAHLACALALKFELEAHLSRQSRLTNLYSGYFFTSMLMTWLPMKPHPPAARSARRQQAHEGADGNGRGEKALTTFQKSAEVLGTCVRARKHTHHL
jgi:hypothetical protein